MGASRSKDDRNGHRQSSGLTFLFLETDGNFDFDHYKVKDDNEPILFLHIVGYINEHNLGDGEIPPTNHWASFLEIARGSVRLEVAPGYGNTGQRAKIELSSKNYQCTKNAIKRMSFSLVRGTTFKTIIDIIISHGCQKYDFTEELEGCRFWVATLVRDLEDSNLVP